MSYMMLLLILPVCLLACLVISVQIVLRCHIMRSIQAMFVGLLIVPVTLAGLTVAIAYLSTTDSELPILAGTDALLSSMLGGWIGASVGCLTNQKNSGQPELEKAYDKAILAAQRQPRRRTVNARLQDNGLTDTSANVSLYNLGSAVVLIIFIGFLLKMIGLGFGEIVNLSKIPIVLRLVGIILPFIVPLLLFVILRRLLPALALGLREGFLSLALIYVPFYIIFNLVAIIR